MPTAGSECGWLSPALPYGDGIWEPKAGAHAFNRPSLVGVFGGLCSFDGLGLCRGGRCEGVEGAG